MDKATSLATLQAARAEWEAALAELDADALAEPGVSGAMSVKDIIAHVAWYEREMVGMLQQRALAGSEWWNLPLAERNAAILAAHRDRPLRDVLAEAQQVYDQFWALAQALSDADLNDPARFRDLPPDWLPWQVIASNTFEHYADHAADLRAWRAQQRKG